MQVHSNNDLKIEMISTDNDPNSELKTKEGDSPRASNTPIQSFIENSTTINRTSPITVGNNHAERNYWDILFLTKQKIIKIILLAFIFFFLVYDFVHVNLQKIHLNFENLTKKIIYFNDSIQIDT